VATKDRTYVGSVAQVFDESNYLFALSRKLMNK